MGKYLIVNADDFGLCKSANDAVIDLFEKGRLFSSTIMMPAPGAEQAVKFAVENPQYAVGIHLTLTSEWQKPYRWGTLTDSPSLIDEEGFMWRESDLVEKNAKSEEIEREVRAQIDKAHSMGMKPSHIDNHMGSLYGHYTGRLSLSSLTFKIMGDYGYAYRYYTKTAKSLAPAGVPYPIFAATTILTKHWSKKYKVITPDYLLFPDWGVMEKKGADTIEKYKKEILEIWTNIPEGVTETFIHPAFDTEEMKQITSTWYHRWCEYNLMNDEETHEILASKGVKLISYRELIKMKKG